MPSEEDQNIQTQPTPLEESGEVVVPSEEMKQSHGVSLFWYVLGGVVVLVVVGVGTVAFAFPELLQRTIESGARLLSLQEDISVEVLPVGERLPRVGSLVTVVKERLAGSGECSFSLYGESVACFDREEKQVRFVTDGRIIEWNNGARIKNWSDQISKIAFNAKGGNFAYAMPLDGKFAIVADDVVWDGGYDEVLNLKYNEDGSTLVALVEVGKKQMIVINGADGKEYNEIGDRFAISLDGERVLYSARDIRDWHVVVGNTAEGPFDGVYPSSLQFSPDGKHYTYRARHDNFRWFVVRDGIKDPLELDNILGSQAFFSPNSEDLAYVGRSGKNTFVISNGIPGLSFPGVDNLLTYNNDGSALAYIISRSLENRVVVNGIEGKKYSKVGYPSFSIDGRHIAYRAEDRTGDNTRYFIVLDEKNGYYYHSGATDSYEDRPVFSPDGEYIAYVAFTGDKDRLGRTTIEAVFVNGVSDISFGGITSGHLVWSPDSTHVAYIASAGGADRLRQSREAFATVGDAIGEKFDFIHASTLTFVDNNTISYVARNDEDYYFVSQELSSETVTNELSLDPSKGGDTPVELAPSIAKVSNEDPPQSIELPSANIPEKITPSETTSTATSLSGRIMEIYPSRHIMSVQTPDGYEEIAIQFESGKLIPASLQNGDEVQLQGSYDRGVFNMNTINKLPRGTLKFALTLDEWTNRKSKAETIDVSGFSLWFATTKPGYLIFISPSGDVISPFLNSIPVSEYATWGGGSLTSAEEALDVEQNVTIVSMERGKWAVKFVALPGADMSTIIGFTPGLPEKTFAEREHKLWYFNNIKTDSIVATKAALAQCDSACREDGSKSSTGYLLFGLLADPAIQEELFNRTGELYTLTEHATGKTEHYLGDKTCYTIIEEGVSENMIVSKLALYEWEIRALISDAPDLCSETVIDNDGNKIGLWHILNI
jgi:hypothetical protein